MRNKSNKAEAAFILSREAERLKTLTYQDLQRYLGTHEEQEVEGLSGGKYILCIEGIWDDKPNENLRVWLEVQKKSGFWRPRAKDDFLVAPDNSKNFPQATWAQKTLVGIIAHIALWIFVGIFAAGLIILVAGLAAFFS